jgi:hypothetical protein
VAAIRSNATSLKFNEMAQSAEFLTVLDLMLGCISFRYTVKAPDNSSALSYPLRRPSGRRLVDVAARDIGRTGTSESSDFTDVSERH